MILQVRETMKLYLNGDLKIDILLKVRAELYKVENSVEELVGTFDGEKLVSVNSGGNET
jgi:hypothetical protein